MSKKNLLQISTPLTKKQIIKLNDAIRFTMEIAGLTENAEIHQDVCRQFGLPHVYALTPENLDWAIAWLRTYWPQHELQRRTQRSHQQNKEMKAMAERYQQQQSAI